MKSILTVTALTFIFGTTLRAELIGYWPLDGGGEALVGADGRLVNAPSPAVDRKGREGGSLAFNGIDQYVGSNRKSGQILGLLRGSLPQ